jgi:hypothetical protein
MRYLSGALALALLAGLALLPTAAADKADGWGTIKGQVVFEGDKIPEREKINVDKNQEHCLSKGPLYKEDWVVNPKNKGVRWVLVWLAPEPDGQPLPIHPDLQKVNGKAPTLDQPICQFVPHCLGIREGQELLVKNSSPISHNVNWTGHPLKNKGGNVLISAGGSYTIKDLKAQKLPLKVACNLHGWMSAWLGVFDHPYFAVTDEDGKFEIKQAPAGKWRLMVWQESIGWRGGVKGSKGEEVTIKPGGTTDLGKLGVKPDQPDPGKKISK